MREWIFKSTKPVWKHAPDTQNACIRELFLCKWCCYGLKTHPWIRWSKALMWCYLEAGPLPWGWDSCGKVHILTNERSELFCWPEHREQVSKPRGGVARPVRCSAGKDTLHQPWRPELDPGTPKVKRENCSLWRPHMPWHTCTHMDNIHPSE